MRPVGSKAAAGGRSRHTALLAAVLVHLGGATVARKRARPDLLVALGGFRLPLETIPEVRNSQSIRPILDIWVIQNLVLDFVDSEGIDVGF